MHIVGGHRLSGMVILTGFRSFRVCPKKGCGLRVNFTPDAAQLTRSLFASHPNGATFPPRKTIAHPTPQIRDSYLTKDNAAAPGAAPFAFGF